MPQVFIETDNSNLRDKIYDGSLAGSESGPVEEQMQKTIRKVVAETADYTTTKTENSKGYIFRLKLYKADLAGREAKCRIKGEILRYPKTAYRKDAEGNQMVSTQLEGGATATGRKALLNCVEAITESLIKDALKILRKDPLRPT